MLASWMLSYNNPKVEIGQIWNTLPKIELFFWRGPEARNYIYIYLKHVTNSQLGLETWVEKANQQAAQFDKNPELFQYRWFSID